MVGESAAVKGTVAKVRPEGRPAVPATDGRPPEAARRRPHCTQKAR